MFRCFVVTVLASVLVLAFPAAAQDLIGKMGDAELRAADLKAIIDAQPPQVRNKLATDLPELARLVQNELLRKVALAEAKQKGWDKRPELQPLIERARDQIVVGAYVASVARPPAEYPSEAELKQFYESNKAQLAVPAQYQLAQIYLPIAADADKAKAEEVRKKITDLHAQLGKPGADFAKLARENSAHKESAAKGGELGWAAEEQMAPEIRATVTKMTKGDVSAPIKSTAGWHLVKLLDKKPAGTPPLADIRANLVAAMRQRKAQELERAYLEALAAKSQPTINQIELNKLQGTLR